MATDNGHPLQCLVDIQLTSLWALLPPDQILKILCVIFTYRWTELFYTFCYVLSRLFYGMLETTWLTYVHLLFTVYASAWTLEKRARGLLGISSVYNIVLSDRKEYLLTKILKYIIEYTFRVINITEGCVQGCVGNTAIFSKVC